MQLCSLLQNYPLFIQTVPTENELKFYYTVHTSLDVVEEKISSVGKNTNDLRELYLGLLYPTEDYKVYLLKISSEQTNCVLALQTFSHDFQAAWLGTWFTNHISSPASTCTKLQLWNILRALPANLQSKNVTPEISRHLSGPRKCDWKYGWGVDWADHEARFSFQVESMYCNNAANLYTSIFLDLWQDTAMLPIQRSSLWLLWNRPTPFWGTMKSEL